MIKLAAIYFAVFITTFFGVAVFRRWSLQREILDIPNERSSHTTPVPRGGGVIICLVSIFAFLLYLIFSNGSFYWTYFAGALIVAVISMVDDLKPISPFLRILFHSLAGGLVVWNSGGFEKLLIPFYGIVHLGIFGYAAAFLWVIWLINAYNFMDGIDGLAAVQAVTAGFGWSLTGVIFGLPDVSFFGGVLAASSLGFLLLNWQPAKIFMGDVGSAFLGYSFAVLPLLGAKETESPFVESLFPWIGVILVWFFVFDAVFTFIKRLFRGEKVWQAHREHIYQQLVISGLSHSRVTIFYGLASILLTGTLVLTLKYSLAFEKTIFLLTVGETVLLVLFWQKRLRLKKNEIS